MDVHFNGFQLKTFFVRHVVQCDGSEVRQVGFGTNRSVLGDLNRNFVSLVLVWEGFDIGQRGADSAFACRSLYPNFVVFRFLSPISPSLRSARLHLFHPFSWPIFPVPYKGVTHGHVISG